MTVPWRLSTLFALAPLAFVLQAQGTQTRIDLAQYSAHAQLGPLGVGADFWGHSIPLTDGSLRSDGYLVVEVAFFAPPSAKVAISAGQFVLTVNGQRLLPQSPGSVTLGYVVPDMRQRGPRVEADGGVGPVVVSAGRDPAQPQFPGDNRPGSIPLPPRPQGSDEELRKEPLDPVKAINAAALPEGLHATPISGYLFFYYSAKLKHIKRAELEYSGPLGTALLSLR